MNEEHSKLQFVDASGIAAILNVRAEVVRKWARQDKIPKIILPNGRFVFEPDAVISALRDSRQHEHLAPAPERMA